MENREDNSILGFWIYLMTDLIMFAVLFAAFVVLRNNTFGAATIGKIVNPNLVLLETLFLLTSSFTCGLGMVFVKAKNIRKTILMFSLTFILGLGFLVMEISEFFRLFSEGNSYRRSGFLSSFFTLLGVHGLHIAVGLFWILILLILVKKRGIAGNTAGKFILLSLFWHFLDIVWLFIFTIVYLLGII